MFATAIDSEFWGGHCQRNEAKQSLQRIMFLSDGGFVVMLSEMVDGMDQDIAGE